MKKNYTTHALAIIDWRDKSQIDKILPPLGSDVFAITAKFINDDEPELFSVVLQYPFVDKPLLNSHKAKLHFFAPQLIMPKLEIGTILHLTDGIKIIGEATISKIVG